MGLHLITETWEYSEGFFVLGERNKIHAPEKLLFEYMSSTGHTIIFPEGA